MSLQKHYDKKFLAYNDFSETLYKHNNSLDFNQKKQAKELLKSLYIQKTQLEKTMKRNG